MQTRTLGTRQCSTHERLNSMNCSTHVETVPDARLVEPTDALVQVTRACVRSRHER